jgi:cytochrome P450
MTFAPPLTAPLPAPPTDTLERGHRRHLRDLPMPPALPWLGHAHHMAPARLHRVLEAWANKLGSVYRLRLMRQDVVVCSDCVLLQEALRQRPQGFRRARSIERVFAEIGANGLFSVEGQAWRPQRKVVMQALAPTQVRSFHPTLVHITERLQARWLRAARAGEVLDMCQELSRYTVDVTTALAFGEDPNTIDQQANVIQDDLALIFPMIMKRTNAPLPWWRWLRLPSDRRFDQALTRVHAHVRGLIERAQQRRATATTAPSNVLEALLAAHDEAGNAMSKQDIAANVLTLLLAGEDTTAHSLAWTMRYLAADPALQDRLHAQARAVLGHAAVCSAYGDMRELDAFEAVATETMRFKPTVPIFFLEPTGDLVLQGHAVPARTPIFFLLRPDMQNAQYFGDPARFRPERWTDKAQPAGCPHNPRAHLQFGAGPRVCPGRNLASVEMRLVLSMLMRRFKVSLACDPQEIDEVMAFTMLPSRMPVRLAERS